MVNAMIVLLTNGLWIVGLAVMLASLSYHYYEARRRKRPFREQATERTFRIAAWVATLLITAGLAATSAHFWEAGLWFLLVIYSVVRIAKAVQENQSTEKESRGTQATE